MNYAEIITSQYLFTLEMLKQTITECPEALWNNPRTRRSNSGRGRRSTAFRARVRARGDGIPSGDDGHRHPPATTEHVYFLTDCPRPGGRSR